MNFISIAFILFIVTFGLISYIAGAVIIAKWVDRKFDKHFPDPLDSGYEHKPDSAPHSQDPTGPDTGQDKHGSDRPGAPRPRPSGQDHPEGR